MFFSVFRNPFDVIDEEEVSIQQSLPQEIEQAFKKITKKDSITRAKGFDELLDYLKQCEDQEISNLAILMRSAFVKIFKKFLFCSEKSSRFAVAEFTRILISKSDAKTFLQPILTEILTLWLLSLFDPVQEVSNLQRKTLEGVFPAGTKLKLLLEKFEKTIWTEILEYTKSEQKFDEIKEIILNEMDGTGQDVEIVIELIKTEIIGVLSLFITNFSGDLNEMKALLFLKDKEISSSRRCAIYRFALKFRATWFTQFVSLLLAKETNPTALCAALELIEKSENSEFEKVLQSEKFAISILSNVPVSEFKRFVNILKRNEIKTAVDWFINICNSNNIMNKERFLIFWGDILTVVLVNEVNRLKVLEKLMFSNVKTVKHLNSSSLTAFIPLTADETMNCIFEAFSGEEICQVCKGRISSQSAFALSFINAIDELEIVLKNLSLGDLQSKELMKIIPEEVLTKRLVEPVEGETFTASEIIRLIQSLPTEKAVKVLEGRKFSDWEKLMKSSLLQRSTVKNVLFRIENFRQFAKEQSEDFVIISCAFESEFKVFEIVPDTNVIVEAMELVSELEIRSPLLKLCIKTLYNHPKINNLSQEKKRKLFEFIELQNEAELFVEFDCKEEEFYPHEYVEAKMRDFTTCPTDPIEILMFKPKTIGNDWLLCKLVSFPLTRFKNQKLVAKCTFLNNLTHLIKFRIPVSCFKEDCSSDFDAFCMSKVIERFDDNDEFDETYHVSDLKKAIILYLKLKSFSDPFKINERLDQLIFNNKLSSYTLMISCSVEPVLPVRSDNLAGLISKLTEENEKLSLLLLASKHLDRNEIKKEFWQVQFREVYKEIMRFEGGGESLEKELLNRVAGGVWDKLTDPEIELLEDCNFKESLESVFKSGEEGSWECFGLARLVLMAAPFMSNLFDLENLVKYYESDTLITPAMELALRSVYLQLHLDERLVAASFKFDFTADLEMDEIGRMIFPFYDELLRAKDKKFAVLLEMFVSAAEGSREDMKLLGGFADICKTRILPILVNDHVIEGTLEEFNFVPRNFDSQELLEHVIHRLCSIFPLIISQGITCDICSRSQQILQQREIERIRRQPRISIESVEILLKPILTSTTRSINLKVKFLEEIELSIDLILSTNFPLEPVRVEGREKSGLAESKWKSALLSLQTLMRSPTFSGNLIEVIKKWQANALKLFQGLEECAVCYSVLHPSDKSLPGPACKQCKHKFHAICLYKWFKSSGNATCPLCRSLF